LITTAETRRSARPWRRPVAEVTAIAASVAGLVVLHDQGVPAGGGIDLYLAIVPVLVAVPVVVVMLRLYPLIIRGLLALSARGGQHAPEVWHPNGFTGCGQPISVSAWIRPATPPWWPAPRSRPSRPAGSVPPRPPGRCRSVPSSRCWRRPRPPPSSAAGRSS